MASMRSCENSASTGAATLAASASRRASCTETRSLSFVSSVEGRVGGAAISAMASGAGDLI